jgi:hypothetical protein
LWGDRCSYYLWYEKSAKIPGLYNISKLMMRAPTQFRDWGPLREPARRRLRLAEFLGRPSQSDVDPAPVRDRSRVSPGLTGGVLFAATTFLWITDVRI